MDAGEKLEVVSRKKMLVVQVAGLGLIDSKSCRRQESGEGVDEPRASGAVLSSTIAVQETLTSLTARVRSGWGRGRHGTAECAALLGTAILHRWPRGMLDIHVRRMELTPLAKSILRVA